MENLPEVLIYLAGGVGLFLVGIKLLSENVRHIVGKNFKSFTRALTKSALLSALWGVGLGFLSQSSRTLALLFSNIVSVGLAKPRQLLIFIIFTNIGVLGIMGLAMVPMQYVALLLTAAAGLAYSIERPKKLLPFYTTFLGIAITLLGLATISGAAGKFMLFGELRSLLEYANESPIYAFIAGALLVILTQSYPAMMLLAISMSSPELSWNTSMAFAMGAHLGSAPNAYLLGLGLKGSPRQIVIYDSLYYCAVVALFYAFCLFFRIMPESLKLLDLLGINSIGAEWKTAGAILSANLAACAIISLGAKYFALIAERISPELPFEHEQRPKYIDPSLRDDIPLAIELAIKEQNRLLKRLPTFVRQIKEKVFSELSIGNSAFSSVEDILHDYIKGMLSYAPDQAATERILNLKEKNYTLSLMERTLVDLATEIEKLKPDNKTHSLISRLFDELSVFCSEFVEACERGDEASLAKFREESAALNIFALRNELATNSKCPNIGDTGSIFNISNLLERFIWLSARYASPPPMRKRRRSGNRAIARA